VDRSNPATAITNSEAIAAWSAMPAAFLIIAAERDG
jgi:hypothetical protein